MFFLDIRSFCIYSDNILEFEIATFTMIQNHLWLRVRLMHLCHCRMTGRVH